MSYGVPGPGSESPGTDAHLTALLAHASSTLADEADECVHRFYVDLEEHPDAKAVLDRLTHVERARLERAQAAHLRGLLSPDLDPYEAQERSREVGRVHAMVGVDLDWYVSASSTFQRLVLDRVDAGTGPADRTAMHAAVGARFTADLHAVLSGYRDVDSAQTRVMMALTQVVADARTVADLARGVLDAMSCLDGIVAGFLGRPDRSGRFQFEVGAGEGVEDFMALVLEEGTPTITTAGGAPSGMGPAGQAWRTGTIVRSDSYLTDAATAPWHEWGRRFGWRSSVAVPLCGPRGDARAMLSFYARWPGYFAHETRTGMLLQIKQMVERALGDLESRRSSGAGVSSFVDRATHVRLLDSEQVEMLYQPVVDLATGRVAKLEGLARLVAGERLLTPAEFLPAFGDDELMRLFDFGVDHALRSLLEWERRGLVTSVSVNLPVMSAYDDRYARAVAWALERFDVAPERLTLELLETGYMDGDLSQRQAALGEFKKLGVRLAQDDLGSGYSSLLRLRHFAFDVVKVDQSLVRGTEFAPRSALHFLRPISDIAHGLGLTVVLEGLESDGLIEAAVQLGVDAGQGYAIARPMPAAAVPGWAGSYRLDLDPERPRTSLGALAGHVAWEHRLTALAGRTAGTELLGTRTCTLSGYLGGRPDAERLAAAHEAVHVQAFRAPGSAAHRAAWDSLAALMGEA